MDTGAIMEQQMQNQIEAGIIMKDEFDDWFSDLQQIAFYGYGAAIPQESQYHYFTYFNRGWSAEDTVDDCHANGNFQ